jgi:hypothetical protein
MIESDHPVAEITVWNGVNSGRDATSVTWQRVTLSAGNVTGSAKLDYLLAETSYSGRTYCFRSEKLE